MIIETFHIPGIVLIKPKIFQDDRGYFLESFNSEKYNEITGGLVFVQDNLSVSHENVIRGLHFQSPPFAQGKLVSVLSGAVIDVAVDLRKSSPTYGQHVSIELNDQEHVQLWIPPGFAHGFLSLKKNTLFSYKCTASYAPNNEQTILWNDPDLAINWKVDFPIVSAKDSLGQSFKNFDSPFG